MKCLLLAGSLSATLAAQVAPGEGSRAPDLSLFLNAQRDDAKGQGLQGRLTWAPSAAWTLFLAGGQSRSSFPPPASPNGMVPESRTGALGVDFLGGRFGLGAQVEQSSQSDLLASRRFILEPALQMESWRLVLSLSSRTTDFDRLSFNDLPITVLNTTFLVTGTADLTLRDTGVGLRAEYEGLRWRIYGAYTEYHYDTPQGRTDVTRIQGPERTVGPLLLRSLSERLSQRMERGGADRLTREAALLDATSLLGLEADLTRSRWGLEVGREVDHLTREHSDTWLGSATWKASTHMNLGLELGTTHSERLGNRTFLGLTLLVKTRPDPMQALLNLF